MNHEFTLSPRERWQLPEMDPDALCYICGEPIDAHVNQQKEEEQ